MDLYTYKDFLAAFLIILFITLQNVRPKNRYITIINTIFYLVFIGTILWCTYRSIFIDGFNDNKKIIIICVLAIILKIIRPYFREKLINIINKHVKK